MSMFDAMTLVTIIIVIAFLNAYIIKETDKYKVEPLDFDFEAAAERLLAR